MKKTLFLLLAATVVGLSACEKDGVLPTVEKQNQPGQMPPSGNYFPLVDGYRWAYSNAAGGADTTKITGDYAYNNITYKFFVSPSGVAYHRVDGSSYYSLEALPVTSADINGLVDHVFLRTDLGVDKSWTETFDLLAGGKLRIEGTLQEIETTRSIKGIKYNNVLKVRTRAYQSTAASVNSFTLTTTFYDYYAQNIGLVESIDATGGNKRILKFN